MVFVSQRALVWEQMWALAIPTFDEDLIYQQKSAWLQEGFVTCLFLNNNTSQTDTSVKTKRKKTYQQESEWKPNTDENETLSQDAGVGIICCQQLSQTKEKREMFYKSYKKFESPTHITIHLHVSVTEKPNSRNKNQ